MVLSLRPETQRFIDSQVKAGRFTTPEEVIEQAIADMQTFTDLELDDETIAAINEGEAQIDRGEGIPFEVIRDYWKKRLGGV